MRVMFFSTGTQITLYTPTDPNPNNTVYIDWINNSSLSNTRFDPTLPVKFVIHGFANTNQTEWLYLMKDALMKTVWVFLSLSLLFSSLVFADALYCQACVVDEGCGGLQVFVAYILFNV